MSRATGIGWADVAARLAPAPNYWLGTIGRDGSPLPTPVWNVENYEQTQRRGIGGTSPQRP